MKYIFLLVLLDYLCHQYFLTDSRYFIRDIESFYDEYFKIKINNIENCLPYSIVFVLKSYCHLS